MSDKPTIPVMRTNGRDFDAILGLYAAISEVEAVGKAIEKRVRSIPGGWRDLRLAQTKMEALGGQLMQTIPPEKLRNLKRMVPQVRFRIVLGRQATNAIKGDETIIGFDDLDVLIQAARDRCKMCADWSRGKCDRCQLGKVMDRVLRYDRKGNDWDTINDDAIANE